MDYEQPIDSTTLNLPTRDGENVHGQERAYMGTVQGDLPEGELTLQRMKVDRRPLPVRRLSAAWRGTPPPMRLVAAVALVALLTLLGAVVVRALPPDTQQARATLGTLTTSFPAPGTLSAATYDVNFAAQGKVAEINVRVGQTVTQGQALAKLDTTLLKDAVANAQARQQAAQRTLDDAQAALARVRAQSQADLATASKQEQAALKSCKTTDTACQNSASNAYTAAQAQANASTAQASAAVDAAQPQIAVAQANLQAAQDTLAAATLTAPHAGTVSDILGTVGSAAGPGSGPALIRLVDLGSLRLTAQVSVNDVGGVQTQQPVRFTVPTFEGRTFLGAVDTVSPAGGPVNGVTRYAVTILVDMNSLNDAHLLPGMPATATITTYSRIGVVLVPESAVSFARAAGATSHGGFLSTSQTQRALAQAQQMLSNYEASGTAGALGHSATAGYLVRRVSDHWVVVPVLLGQGDGRRVEVLSAGMPGSLKVGDTVVTAWNGGPVTSPTPTPAVH